jgi:hypothetical protein
MLNFAEIEIQRILCHMVAFFVKTIIVIEFSAAIVAEKVFSKKADKESLSCG